MSNVTNAKTAKSLTDRTSLANRAISVALSVVLLGFGWPTTSLSKAYAEDEAATENTQVESPATTDQAATDATSEAPATSENSADKAPATDEGASSTTTSDATATEGNAGATSSAPASSETPATATQPEASATDDGTASVSLSLGNASIEYNNQTIALPSTSVTVPNTEDFKFAVSPDTGYEVKTVKEKTKGAASDVELTADSSDVYTVSAADVKVGATVSIETKKKATTNESASASAEGGSSNGVATDADTSTGEVKNPEASEIDKDTVIKKDGDTTAADNEKPDDATDEDELAKEDAINQGSDKFDELKDGLAAGSATALPGESETADPDAVIVSSADVVTFGDVFTLTCTKGSSWEWYSGFPVSIAMGQNDQTVTLKVDNPGWAFNGDTYTYQDLITVRYDNDQYAKYSLSLTKRDFTVSPAPFFSDENAEHYWVPTITDAKTGEVLSTDGGKFTIEYYKNGVYIGNQYDVRNKSYWAHQAGKDEESLYGPGSYSVKVISADGWAYKSGETVVEVPDAVQPTLELSGDDTVEEAATIDLSAILTPAGLEGTYEWSSSDEDTLTVDENGTVTGVAAGTATVTVTFTGTDGTVLTASKDVTVTKAGYSEQKAYFYLARPDLSGIDNNSTSAWLFGGEGSIYAPTGAAQGTTISGSVDDAIRTAGTYYEDKTFTVNGKQYKYDADGTGADGTFSVVWDTAKVAKGSTNSNKWDGESGVETRFNWNDLDWHVDGHVVLHDDAYATVTYAVQEAGSDTFATASWSGNTSVSDMATDGAIATVSTTTKLNELQKPNYPETRTVNGETYKLEGWYSDESLDVEVDLTSNDEVGTGARTYYAAYIPSSLTIEGESTVEQFSTISLTANLSNGDWSPRWGGYYGTYTWSSSNDNILTVSKDGSVTTATGVRQGKATVTCTFTSYDGKTVLTATHDVEVTASTQGGEKTLFFYLNNPNTSLDSISTGGWTSMGTGVANYSGVSWGKDNGETKIYDRVGDRVVSWPDGKTGSTYEVERDSDWWNNIVVQYKSEIQKQLPNQNVTDDMIESITIVPYKMTYNDDGKHIDCRVVVKCKSLFTVKYFVSDPSNASSQGFAEVAGNIAYKSGDTTNITDLVPNFTDIYPITKEVNGVEYTFDGWYTDEACTQRVSLPYTITDSNVNFYAKYLSGRQVIYDLAGGTWGNSDATTYAATEGSTQKVKSDPSREGYEFEGWTVEGLDDTTTLKSGDTFTMPNNNVTITAQWKQLLSCEVKYVEQTTGEEIADADILYGNAGDVKTATAKNIDGYHLVSPEQNTDSATLIEGETPEIVFYYAKDLVPYTVNYYWNGTTEKAAETVTGEIAWGTTINAEKTIEGYTAVPNQSAELTVLRDKDNTIDIYYYKNVELTANSATETYDGTEKSVSGFTGAPDGVTFSKIGKVSASGTAVGTYDATFPNDTVGVVDDSDKYYVVSATNGSLTINPSTAEVVVAIEGSTDSAKYDGDPHSVSGYAVMGITLDGKATTLFTKENVSLENGVSAAASGINAGTYNMGLTEASFESNNKNFANVKFVVTDGKLEIEKRKVTLTSATDSKAYDGTPLTNTNVTVSGEDGFLEGHGASYSFTGSQTEVGGEPNNNTFAYTLTGGASADNYDIACEYGTLTVTNRAKDDLYAIEVVGKSGNATYDGEPHTISGITDESTTYTTYTNDKGVTFNISATTSGATGTDAGSYTNAVSNVKVTDANGNDVTSQFDITTVDGTFTITPKEATITAGSAEKKYDGEPLTIGQTDSKFTVDGFVAGQGIASCYIEGSQTLVGTSNSTVRDKSWTFLDGTNPNNYTIATKPGTLTVNKSGNYAITLTGASGESTYDGAEHTIDKLVTDKFTFDGVEYTVSNYVVSGSGTTYKEGGYDVTVTSGEGGYKVTDPNGTDVTKQFEINVEPGKLTINKRLLRIIAGSASKKYDGTPLKASSANPKYTIDESTPLADGDEIAWVNVNGSQTEAGTSASSIGSNGTDISLTNYDSYEIERVNGTLEVTTNDDPVTVTIQENSKQATYDGTEQTVSGYTVTSISNALYKEGDFEYVGSDADKTASGTDAGSYDMNLKPEDFENTSENFNNVTFEIVDGSLTINKRKITLASDTPNAKTYDGTALTSKIVRLTEGELASGDDFTYDVTGSQTDAGTSDNTFSYKLISKATGEELARDGKGYKNYDVTAYPGSLTVNPVYSKVTVTIAGHHKERPYNGSALEVEGYDFSSDNKLYTEDMVSFSGSAKASQTDAGTSSMGLVGKFTNADRNNFRNVEFKVTDGYATVTPATVTLKSADLTHEYDGEALVNGDTALETESGWAPGEGATYTFTGSQTVVGSSANAFTYKLKDGTRAENYSVTPSFGTLTVTNRDAKYEITVKANSSTAKYDGQPHSVEGVETTQFEIDGNKYAVEGLTTENPTETDAGTYSNNITGTPVVKDAYGNDVTSQFTVKTENGSLVINERNVTLASASAEKQYDGTPLTREEVAVSGDGFAEGEGATYDFFGTGQTQVGGDEGNNKFTYTLGGNTKAGNYNITTSFGTLTVTQNTAVYTITISGNNDELKYNGSEQSVSGYTVDIPKALKGIYSEGDIAYSGDAIAKGTDARTYKMNLDASKFSNKNASFTNMRFEVKTDGQLVIGKRDVTLTAASDKKPYDGTPLTNSTVTPAGDGFVAGEAVNVRAEGSITNVGTTDNVVKYETAGRFNANNYNITTVNGTLEVTAGTLNAVKVVWDRGFYQEYYDGQSHPAPLATATDEYGNSLTVEYSGDDGKTWTTNREDIQAKNYSDSKIVLLRARSDNYAEDQYSYDAEWLTIGKRFVKLVSASDSKTYDGNALTNSTVTATVGGKYKGFVESEGATYDVTGSQTNVGESSNTFTYSLKEGTLPENYAIEKEEGKLKVNADDGQVVVTIKGNSATKDYTGEEQSVTGYEVERISNPLYTANDFTFSGNATAKGVEAGTYSMGLKAEDFSNKSDNFANVTFVVEDGSLTITGKGVDANGMTVEAPSDVVYNGKPQQQKPVVKDGDKTLVEDTDYTLSYSEDTTNAGEVTVTVTGKGNYSGTTTVTYRITKAPVTLTSGSAEFTYNGQDQSLPNVAATGDAAELFKSQVENLTATGKAKNAGDKATNAIAYTWKSGYTEDNFAITKSEGELTVAARAIGSIAADSPNNATYDGKGHKWAPVVTDGNTVLAEDVDYTVSYDKSDFTNVTGTITVTIAAKGNYSGSVTREYEITPATATVTTEGGEKVYDGTPLTAPGHIELVNGETAEVVTTNSQTAVGSIKNDAYTINWNGSAKASNYTVTEGDMGTLEVTAQSFDPKDPANKGIAISDPTDVMYDGAAHKWAPDVRDANGFMLSEGVDYTVSYSTNDFISANDEIKVTVKGVGNYSGDVTKTYKISKRPVIVGSDSKSKAYDGTPLTYDNAFVIGYYDFVKGDVTKLAATGSITDPGTTKNTISIAWANDAAKSYEVTKQEGDLTVTAAGIKVGELSDVVYNGLDQKQKPEVTSNGKVLVEGADYELSYTGDTKNVGKVTVTVTGKGKYTGSYEVSYFITPATLTVTTPSDSKQYDGTPLTAEGVIEGFVEVDGVAETAALVTTGSQTTVGSSTNWYSIDWNGTAKQSNYTISESLGTLTVTEYADEVVVATTGFDGTYDGMPHGATVAVTGLPAGYTYQASSNAEAIDANAFEEGDKGILATADNLVIYNENREDVTANLKITRKDGSIKITPATLTVTTPSTSKVYDGTPLTAEGSISGFVPGETATFETTGSQTAVGKSSNAYKLTWNDSAKESNYTVSEDLGTLEVTAQSIDPNDPNGQYTGLTVDYPQNIVYDGVEHKWVPTVTDKNGTVLTEGTDYDVSYSTDDFTNVAGTITVTIVAKGNYSGSVTREYEITPATLVVTTPTKSKVYDGTPLTAEGTIEGFIEVDGVAETATFTTTGSQTEVNTTPNSYTIEWDGTAQARNYTIDETVGTLTVTENADAIVVTTTGGTFTYDGSAHGATSVTVSELPAGYVLDHAESTTTVTNVDDGMQGVTADDLIIRNVAGENVTARLNIRYVDDTIQITPAPLAVTTGSASKYYDGTPLTNNELKVEGIVEGDQLIGKTTGSQTEIGQSDNTYELSGDSWNHGNYLVTEETLGKLTVYQYVPPTPTPDPDNPTPPTPDPDNPEPSPDPDNPDVPVTPDTPNEPTSPDNPNGPNNPSTPTNPSEPSNSGNSNASDNANAPATPSVNATPASPTNTPIDAIAETLENVYEAVTGDTGTDENAQQEERIYDAENPLGVEKSSPDRCWMHWYLLLGTIATLVYGTVVSVRRRNMTKKLEKEMNAVLSGSKEGSDE